MLSYWLGELLFDWLLRSWSKQIELGQEHLCCLEYYWKSSFKTDYWCFKSSFEAAKQSQSNFTMKFVVAEVVIDWLKIVVAELVKSSFEAAKQSQSNFTMKLVVAEVVIDCLKIVAAELVEC